MQTKHLESLCIDFDLLKESKDLTKEEKQALIEKFKEENAEKHKALVKRKFVHQTIINNIPFDKGLTILTSNIEDEPY